MRLLAQRLRWRSRMLTRARGRWKRPTAAQQMLSTGPAPASLVTESISVNGVARKLLWPKGEVRPWP